MDGRPLEDFPAFAREPWPPVRPARLDGTSQPAPVRRVAMPKPGGRGARQRGIPTVRDRVIAPAIAPVLTPLFDPECSASSCGVRPGRSAHGALRQVPRDSGEGYRIAVELDLEQFCDRVSHDVLRTRVARKVREQRLLSLIGRYLRAGVLGGDCSQATEGGTAQGSPLSPWLAKVVLDDLDKALERRGHRFARYADDLLVLVHSRRAGERVKTRLTRVLTPPLKLSVNESMSRVGRTEAVVFRGVTCRGTQRRWSEAAFADFKHRVRHLTGRSGGVARASRLERLARSIRGWRHDFGLSDDDRPIPELDPWRRRRLRLG